VGWDMTFMTEASQIPVITGIVYIPHPIPI
jgi:hypothetical protein